MGLVLIKFPDGFDADMAYQLRERDPTTLDDAEEHNKRRGKSAGQESKDENGKESDQEGGGIFFRC